MSKITNIFYMLDLLSSGNKYTVNQLAEKINVTPRMVRYYKKTLEEAGIYIDSYLGYDGGYFLNKSLPKYLNLNKYDLELMYDVKNILIQKNYNKIKSYNKLIDKLSNIYNVEEEKSKFIINYKETTFLEIFDIINEAITKKQSVKIVYRNLAGDFKEREIEPIYIFEYDGNMLVTAFCKFRSDFRHFEFSRIESII